MLNELESCDIESPRFDSPDSQVNTLNQCSCGAVRIELSNVQLNSVFRATWPPAHIIIIIIIITIIIIYIGLYSVQPRY